MLYNRLFLLEILSEVREQFIRVLDCVHILSYYPDHGGFSLGVLQL